MSDLIRRKDAIDALGEEPIVLDEWKDEYNLGMRTLWALTKRDIESLPSIDAVSVKHGRWIKHNEIKNIYGGKYIECSECGEKYVVQYIEDEKFCRNCGARMDGEEDG